MKILAIDTTTKFLCVGVYDGAKICGYTVEAGVRLSSLLEASLKRILDALGWQASDIDYFACGIGPGSFTGVRVGLSAIKGMAFSLRKPIIGLPSLDILARNAKKINGSFIIPAIDAKRGLIYCSAYQVKGNSFKRAMPYLLLTPEDFLKKVKPGSTILGDAASLLEEKDLKEKEGVDILGRDYWRFNPQYLIELALERIKEAKINTPFKINPIYLYPKECQIRR